MGIVNLGDDEIEEVVSKVAGGLGDLAEGVREAGRLEGPDLAEESPVGGHLGPELGGRVRNGARGPVEDQLSRQNQGNQEGRGGRSPNQAPGEGRRLGRKPDRPGG